MTGESVARRSADANRLGAVLEATGKAWQARVEPTDMHLDQHGRVMELLSEHTCQGWLEGYLLTGRHGLFSCYEAFIHIVDSMFNQHAKWLKVTRDIPWRRPIASLNYLLTSHVWRQDHNGFSHQDPGFIDHVVNKKAEIVRVYLPPDANCLLSVTDHCLRSRNYVNVIIAGKQLAPQWLNMDQAVKHCTAGIGIWEWASNDRGSEPDVVMACCGDVPTMETLAAVELLRRTVREKGAMTVGAYTTSPETERELEEACERIVQAPVAPHVIDKGLPTTGLLAQVLVAKYLDHLPLYRQEAIFERAGHAIARSTLAQWVGECGVQLQPLVDALTAELLRQRRGARRVVRGVLSGLSTAGAVWTPSSGTPSSSTDGSTEGSFDSSDGASVSVRVVGASEPEAGSVDAVVPTSKKILRKDL